MTKRGRSAASLGLLACLVVAAGIFFLHWTDDDPYYYDYRTAAAPPSAVRAIDYDTSEFSRRQARVEEDGGAPVEVVMDDASSGSSKNGFHNVTICGRPTSVAPAMDPSLVETYRHCDPSNDFDPHIQTLVLEGFKTFGRTGNQIRTFLNAVQYTRDNGFQLAVMYNSWAMDVLLQFFFADRHGLSEDEWLSNIERELCVKVVRDVEVLEGWKVLLKSTKSLFQQWKSQAEHEEYVASQLYSIRTLFGHYNAGKGVDLMGQGAGDMCSGVEALFGDANGAVNELAAEEPGGLEPGLETYSVVHLRYLEGIGVHILGMVSASTGCDPYAAIVMAPSYVKSILRPLGMLDRPIVIISDGQDRRTLDILLADPEIGPRVRLVPKDARWFGGDVMLGVAADVFIGNPASTMSGLVARARAALGMGHSYLYMRRDVANEGEGEGEGWTVACGDECLFLQHNEKDPEWIREQQQQHKSSPVSGQNIPSPRRINIRGVRGQRKDGRRWAMETRARTATIRLGRFARGKKGHTHRNTK